MNDTPFSMEAEQAVLGALLLNGEVFDTINAFLTPNHFFIARNREIYSAMQTVRRRNEPIDFVVLQVQLKACGVFEDIGGLGYLMQLATDAPTSMNAEVYARLVERAATRRRMMEYADTVKALAIDETMDTDTVLSRAVADAQKLAISHIGDRGARPLSDYANEYLYDLEASEGSTALISGLATGFHAYDDMMDGAQPDSLNTIAGATGMGKTALMLSIALNIIEAGGTVYFWSGEMPGKQLLHRLLSRRTRINSIALRRGLRPNGFHPSRLGDITDAIARPDNMRLFINDGARLTPTGLQADVQRIASMHGGVTAVFVDYIQRMPSGQDFKGNRTAEVSFLARSLKQVAGEVHVPVFAGAQINRAAANRENKRPTLADLRESGDIENESDTVTFVYRDAYYNSETLDADQAELILAKNRHGGTGMVPVRYDKQLTWFMDGEKRTVDFAALEAL